MIIFTLIPLYLTKIIQHEIKYYMYLFLILNILLIYNIKLNIYWKKATDIIVSIKFVLNVFILPFSCLNSTIQLNHLNLINTAFEYKILITIDGQRRFNC